MNLKKVTLTQIDGILVGHKSLEKEKTGCSVVLCPPQTTCAVEHIGSGFGMRETQALVPDSMHEYVDGIVLAGGSTFGLGVADGVLKYLREKKRGLNTAGGTIPVVPAAIIYDLLAGDQNSFPDARMGYEACSAANSRVLNSGPIGAGCGARVKKYLGIKESRSAGIGNAGVQVSPEIKIAVMLVVNSYGDILNPDKTPNFTGLCEVEKNILEQEKNNFNYCQNTIIGVVATNAGLSQSELKILTRMAHAGIAKVVTPSHTPFDGDTIFALSTGSRPYDVLALGVLAQKLAQVAVFDAVNSGY